MLTFPSGAFPNGGWDSDAREPSVADLYWIFTPFILAAIFGIIYGAFERSLIVVALASFAGVGVSIMGVFERRSLRGDLANREISARQIDSDPRPSSLDVLATGHLDSIDTIPVRVDRALALACANAEEPRVSRLLTILRDPATPGLSGILAIVVAVVFGLLALYGVKL